MIKGTFTLKPNKTPSVVSPPKITLYLIVDVINIRGWMLSWGQKSPYIFRREDR